MNLVRPFFRLVTQMFPNGCLLCGATSGSKLICWHCHESLPRLEKYPHRCSSCALPLAAAAPLCGLCLQRRAAFTLSHIAFSYEHPVDYLIHQFKYRQQLTSGKALGDMLVEHCRTAERPDFLVPAPIHWYKRWQRGFNQTEVLSRHLGNALQLPIVHAIRQVRYHPSQKSLGRRERQKNLRMSLAIVTSQLTKIRGAHIVLVDDVVTTTATTRALSELLLKAGARRVDVWALARTLDA